MPNLSYGQAAGSRRLERSLMRALPALLVAASCGVFLTGCAWPDASSCPPPAAAVDDPQNPALQPRVGDAAQDAVTHGWLRRHERNVARAARGDIDVLFQGDSILEGAGASGPGWSSEFALVHWADFGIGGDRTENVLWRVQNGELDGFTPRVIVLLIGTNNLFRDAPEQIVAGIQAILYELRTRQPQARVLLLGLLPRGEDPNDPLRAKIEAVNARLAELTDCAIEYRDYSDLFLASDKSIRRELMSDYLHPSALGAARFARALHDTLSGMLFRR